MMKMLRKNLSKMSPTNIIAILITTLASTLVVEGGREERNLPVRVHVPAYVREGDRALLKCLHNVSVDNLYTIKWYKGPDEFYRFTPKENPVIKTFSELGRRVDPSSNSSIVGLHHVDLNMSGTFGCEVTMDSPHYYTGVGSGKMTVVALPENKPVITTERRTVTVGDTFSVNCTSFRSKPIANLTWLLNELPVSPHYLTPEVKYRDVDNKETITIGLNFIVRHQHFIRGQMTLTCVAKIEPEVYTDSSDVIILEHDRPKISSVVDNYSSFPTSGGNSDSRTGSSLLLLLTTSAAVPLAQLLLTLTTSLGAKLTKLVGLFVCPFLALSFLPTFSSFLHQKCV